jgi:hypothetical protein
VSEVVGLYELLDLRVHRVFTAKLYENGDTTDDGTSTAQNGRQPRNNEDQRGVGVSVAHNFHTGKNKIKLLTEYENVTQRVLFGSTILDALMN